MLDKEELKNIDDLIDRRNLMYCQMNENQLPDSTYFSVIELKLVKQVNDKQRYWVYEYVALMECIQRV